MKPRDPARRLAGEVARAAARSRAARTLLLDLDGTLAPIAPVPAQARVPETVRTALRALLRAGWTIAIVTGRPGVEARRLLRIRGIAIVGAHGASRRLTDRQSNALRRAALRARIAARGIPGVLVEPKPQGLALHDRRVPPGKLRLWRRRVARVLHEADLPELEVLRGRRVIEVRPRGAHKGLALEPVVGLRRRRSRGPVDASLVALGDDRTDEDLFRAIRGRGLGVRIGRSGVRSQATRRLASPTAVGRFLTSLASGGEGELP